ncbi:MAG: methionyl-tRNA formyltransferase [Cyanobacteria bacterium SIG30]|nr:methionyl-tRNA formyltransferase [Cyanobacteria bacterium SIG30]
MEKIKLVYFATPKLALSTFEHILNSKDFEVLALVTQTPKPSGRGNKIIDSELKKCALEHNIEVIETPKISKDIETLRKLKAYGADFFVTFAFGQILSQEVLDIPKCATINVHPSLLPKYRGSNPIRACLLNGDCKTGITTAVTVLALDEGDIVLQEEFEITPDTTSFELEEIIEQKAPKILEETLIGLKECKLKPYPQLGEVCYTIKTKKEDKNLCFNLDCTQVHNKIRALLGQYTCQSTFNGKLIKFTKTTCAICDKNIECGEVVEITKKGIVVKCSKGAILVQKVKPEGKGEMDAYVWSLGSKIKIGDKFGS